MERRLSVLLLLFLTALSSWALPYERIRVPHDFVVDGIYYKINDGGESVSVYMNTSGDYWNYYYQSLPAGYSGDVVIPESVTYEDVTYPVTGIGQCAFVNCTSLSSVTVPNTITTVGEGAFYNCTSLSSLSLPNSVSSIGNEAFSRNTSLVSFTVPTNVSSIPDAAFFRCTSLTNISLAEGITNIGNGAFSGCTQLATISIPQTVTSIYDYAFQNCQALEEITIPQATEWVGNYVFQNCTKLTTVRFECDLDEIEDGEFKNIGTNLFAGCLKEKDIYVTGTNSALALCLNDCFPRSGNDRIIRHFYIGNKLMTEMDVPEGIGIIPEQTFASMPDLKSVTLPSTLTTIGEWAFAYCNGLEEIDMPSVVSIKRFAFRDCTSLTEITFGNSLSTVEYLAFDNCSSLTKVDIGDLANWCSVVFGEPSNDYSGATESNPLTYARKIYVNGEQLNELRIPSGVTKISKYAFNNCLRFDVLSIPNSVETIEDNAFANCTDLETITFGKRPSLTTIGNQVFKSCTGLTEVTLPNSVTSVGGVFYDCTNLMSANIPQNVAKVGPSMFYNCKKLTSITIPEGCEGIGSSAFEGSGLTSVHIPSSITYVNTHAFKNCYSLTAVKIDDLAAWCGIKYGNTLNNGGGWGYQLSEGNPLIYAHNLYLNNELVTNLVIPDGVTVIEPYAFWQAYCLESIVVPEGVTNIGTRAFRECKNVSSLTLPSTLETIGDNVFDGAMKTKENSLYINDLENWIKRVVGGRFWNTNAINVYLNGELIRDLVIPEGMEKMIGEDSQNGLFTSWNIESVTLPKSLEKLSSSAFQQCYGLKYIYSKAKFAPELLNNAQNSESTLLLRQTPIAIYVPKNRADAYKNKWSGNAAQIVAALDELVLDGEQTAENIKGTKTASNVVNGMNITYVDLRGATLDESVTEEALKAGDGNSNVLYFLPTGSNITGENIIVDGAAENVRLKDGADIYVPEDFTVTGTLTYERSIAASTNNAYTICLPYDQTVLPEGLRAYTMKETDDNGNLVFTEVKSMEANMPYLITASTPISSLSAENLMMKATPNEMDDAGTEAYEFHGTLSKISNDDAAYMEAYILQANKEWHPVSTDRPSAYIAAGRAYIVPTGAASRGVISSVFNSISGIKTISRDGTRTYYDLQGRRINKPTKGLYISNGKIMNVN